MKDGRAELRVGIGFLVAASLKSVISEDPCPRLTGYV